MYTERLAISIVIIYTMMYLVYISIFSDPSHIANLLKSKIIFTKTTSADLIKPPTSAAFQNQTQILDLPNEFLKTKFSCPTFDQVNFPPVDCNSREKKYPKVYQHDFFTLHVPHGHFSVPGPSEQTNAIKQMFMATAYLNKGLMISNFTVHKTDKISKIRNIPFGLRVDMDQMCNFIHLTSAQQKIQHYLDLGAKVKAKHVPVSKDKNTLYMNDLVIVRKPGGSGYKQVGFFNDTAK